MEIGGSLIGLLGLIVFIKLAANSDGGNSAPETAPNTGSGVPNRTRNGRSGTRLSNPVDHHIPPFVFTGVTPAYRLNSPT